MLICDSQVHAPDVKSMTSPVGGLSRERLLDEMDRAGVRRAVIVPILPYVERCFEYTEKNPDRFRVMGVLNLTEGEDAYRRFMEWKSAGKVVGLRVSFAAAKPRAMLEAGSVDWLWNAANKDGLAVMVNVPNLIPQIRQAASRHGDIRFAIDHMSLVPRKRYTDGDFDEVIDPLIELASLPNVAVKASCLPSSVMDSYPYRSIHRSVQKVVDAFGPSRVFWGSDLSRLPSDVSYAQCVQLFTEGIDFLSDSDRELIMGRAICSWLG